jgi:hypothetical protein
VGLAEAPSHIPPLFEESSCSGRVRRMSSTTRASPVYAQASQAGGSGTGRMPSGDGLKTLIGGGKGRTGSLFQR